VKSLRLATYKVAASPGTPSAQEIKLIVFVAYIGKKIGQLSPAVFDSPAAPVKATTAPQSLLHHLQNITLIFENGYSILELTRGA
jgi:hypothetical protein